MWRYYLSIAAASFRAGVNDVWQILSPVAADSRRAPAQVSAPPRVQRVAQIARAGGRMQHE
jgi:hypothetical protein